MRVLVCGGRTFSNRRFLTAILNMVHKEHTIHLLIHGGAKGADTLAGEWAQGNKVEVLKFPANWKKYGNAAGPVRNQQMLDEGRPDLVLAFPGGVGTADMVNRAMKAAIPTHICAPGGDD